MSEEAQTIRETPEKLVTAVRKSVLARPAASTKTARLINKQKLGDKANGTVDIGQWPADAIAYIKKLRRDLAAHPHNRDKPNTTSPHMKADVQMTETVAQPEIPHAKLKITSRAQTVPKTPTGSRLLSQIAAASTHAPTIASPNGPRPAHGAIFTTGPFPPIHYSHPMAHIDNIDPN
ncbi:hypothetical protein HETIRDRAFT_119555 [Heterobasidion irregulare TC 32-1]|uniref:Uncharacterized protein n=1 Tax=Heterobasidion irregulare (strain TC 32-1) TaxID=747525 RepID=W4KAN1_HETIT|nr:uncharacterized protein HETIRDRAFT_119555 [Heterobasidion irregulare TC 32-1]ETW82843.1 hypothetical protein HETIRDRAFT_119555 [Heterobasidion irregulare TC 32-1]